MCCIGNRRSLIKRCPDMRPGKDTQVSSNRTANTERKSTDGRILKVLLYGNWTLTRGNQGVLLFASRAMKHGHGHWERRRCRQRSLTLETWFTPSDEETETWHRGEASTKERKWHGNIAWQRLHMHLLQARPSLPYGLVQLYQTMRRLQQMRHNVWGALQSSSETDWCRTQPHNCF